MFVYNVTVKVDWSIHDAWLKWMQQEHIPDVSGTGCFTNAKLYRLLEQDDEAGPTYTVQYFASSKSDYSRYIEKFAVIMRQKVVDKWADRFIAFRSVMELVSE